MKKLMIVVVFAFMAAMSVSAQTYCYKWIYSVDPQTGVKSQADCTNCYEYYTITNGGNICYSSNRDGTLKSTVVMGTRYDMPKYQFQGVQNGMRIYNEIPMSLMGFSMGGDGIYRFSSDYSRLNVTSKGANWLRVLERVSSPEESSPVQMY